MAHDAPAAYVPELVMDSRRQLLRKPGAGSGFAGLATKLADKEIKVEVQIKRAEQQEGYT